MIGFTNIKLIIWDLDETLWKGTLSDNNSLRLTEEFVNLINDSLDRGIVHSICSKNDFDSTKAYLESLGLWNLFVFPSINWESKGERIKKIIDDMKLRPANVLFVDDNSSNLQEAVYYNSDLQICSPDDLLQSIDGIFEIQKIDKTRPRLNQYRLLEQKNQSQQSFSSNEDFLMSCDIRVAICKDCLSHLERIHDLIMRSNQLNYTKFRQSKEDLASALTSPDTEAAYVTVKDSFGDYGIVGFYMITKGKVIHYLFSCRTLGMLVEQYIYMQIGCPDICVVGDVITPLNNTDVPVWINQANGSEQPQKSKVDTGNQTILFKGPCDISQIFSFIEETPTTKTEFTYINDKGISVEGYNHTAQIVTALKATTADKEKLVRETPWLDSDMLDSSCWSGNDAIVFSLLSDGNLGIYQHKETGWQIALCEKYYDLTDSNNWDNYINANIFTSLISFTEESLVDFAQKYTYVDNDSGDLTVQNLDTIYQSIGDSTKFILILGSELPFENPSRPSYKGRHLLHKTVNDKVKKWADDKNNVFLIEISNYISSQKDYTDTINHFQKKVYYHIAQDILPILNDSQSDIKIKGKLYLYYIAAKNKLRYFLKRLINRF